MDIRMCVCVCVCVRERERQEHLWSSGCVCDEHRFLYVRIMSHVNLSISGCVTGAQVWISEVCDEHNVCVCGCVRERERERGTRVESCVCVCVCVCACVRARERGTCVDVRTFVFECMRKTNLCVSRLCEECKCVNIRVREEQKYADISVCVCAYVCVRNTCAYHFVCV